MTEEGLAIQDAKDLSATAPIIVECGRCHQPAVQGDANYRIRTECGSFIDSHVICPETRPGEGE